MTETQTQPKRTHFSPANQLLDEIEDFCKTQIFPNTHTFARWYNNGTALWLESSSGSRLMTVDFVKGVITVPKWATGEYWGIEAERPIPAHWVYFHTGSMFTPDGEPVDRIAYEESAAAWVRGTR